MPSHTPFGFAGIKTSAEFRNIRVKFYESGCRRSKSSRPMCIDGELDSQATKHKARNEKNIKHSVSSHRVLQTSG